MQPRVDDRRKSCGAKFQKEKIIYFFQVLKIYIVVVYQFNKLVHERYKYLPVVISNKRNRRLSSTEPGNQQYKENDVISYDSTIEQQHHIRDSL